MYCWHGKLGSTTSVNQIKPKERSKEDHHPSLLRFSYSDMVRIAAANLDTPVTISFACGRA